MNPHIINRNHAELKRLLAILFVMIGLADTISDALAANDRLARAMRGLADPATISRRLHRTILALLIPVESATRRLIIYMAAMLPTPVLTAAQLKGGVPMWPLPMRPSQPDEAGTAQTKARSGEAEPDDGATPDCPTPEKHPPPFALVDPRPKWIWAEGKAAPFPGIVANPASAFVQVSDVGLMRRVAALAFALEDMAAQALRYARWRARSAAFLTRHHRALRLGPPPGAPSRRTPKSKHRIEHEVLAETDGHARFALTQTPPAPDTS